eukprot:1679228-Rhodomonas_salina.1
MGYGATGRGVPSPYAHPSPISIRTILIHQFRILLRTPPPLCPNVRHSPSPLHPPYLISATTIPCRATPTTRRPRYYRRIACYQTPVLTDGIALPAGRSRRGGGTRRGR